MLWNWDARSRPRLERVRKADHGAKALARFETLNAALKRRSSTTLYATSSCTRLPRGLSAASFHPSLQHLQTKKWGCRVSMSPDSPKIASPSVRPKLQLRQVTLVTLRSRPTPGSTAVAGKMSSLVFSVGTAVWGHRPRREPVGRQQLRMCPLVLPSGSTS